RTPLAIRENKSARVHSNLLFWKVESELKPNGNPECPQALKKVKPIQSATQKTTYSELDHRWIKN
ncbi:hypothetical protein, partial [Halovulum sp. GXIMD14793]